MIFSLENLYFFRVSKWNVIFVCGYGCKKKTIIKKKQTSLYLNMFGYGGGITHFDVLVENEIGGKYFS